MENFWKVAGLLAIFCMTPAHAEFIEVEGSQAAVVFDDVSFIEGSQGIVAEFELTAPGNYLARLTDYEFPVAFDQLALTIVTNNEVVATLETDGDVGFSISAPGRFFAIVFGATGDSSQLGLYGLQIADLAPVPVPAALLLFGSALTTLLWRRRRT